MKKVYELDESDLGKAVAHYMASIGHTVREVAFNVNASSNSITATATVIASAKPSLPPESKPKYYECPVCGINDPNAFQRCYDPGCPDGRDPR